MEPGQKGADKRQTGALETHVLDTLISEKMLSHILKLEARVAELETGPVAQRVTPMGGSTQTLGKLESELRNLRSELTEVNNRAANMRLDRQVKLGLKRISKKVTQTPTDLRKNRLSGIEQKRAASRREMDRKMTVENKFAVICGAYPGGSRGYGGQFIKSRLDCYYAKGLKPTVIEVSARTREVMRHQVDGVDVLRVNAAGLAKVLRLSKIDALGVHSIERPVWSVIKPFVENHPLIIWVHGFEARRWQELHYNFTEEELETLRPRLDRANSERMKVMSEVMTHPNAHCVFVSHYMRTVAEGFAGVRASKGYVIPNPVSPRHFPYSRKSAADRLSILWVRSFSAMNYASDISRDVILGLSKKDYFDQLKVTIVGDGKHFDEATEPLRDFSNVTIRQEFVQRDEMNKLYRTHGVQLVPTRWDSQGLTACEAMHCGLVPLTSYVAGLREYVNEDCAILAGLDEVQPLIDGYDRLYKDPDLYRRMSENAHRYMSQRCLPAHTVQKEINLIQSVLKTPPSGNANA